MPSIKDFTDQLAKPLANLSGFFHADKPNLFERFQLSLLLFTYKKEIRSLKTDDIAQLDIHDFNSLHPEIVAFHYATVRDVHKMLHRSYKVMVKRLPDSNEWPINVMKAEYRDLLKYIDSIKHKFDMHYRMDKNTDGDLLKRIDPYQRIKDRPLSRKYIL